MRRRHWGRALSLAASAAFSIAMYAPASAADFTINTAGIDPAAGQVSGYIFFSGLGGGAGHENVSIGRLLLQGTAASGESVAFATYCADIFDTLQSGTFSDAAAASLPFDASRLTAVSTFLAHADPLVSSAESSAAAQLGVWEILNEQAGAAYDVTSGAFYASGSSLAGAEALANGWLASLSANDWEPDPRLHLAIFAPGAGNQAQIRMIAGGSSLIPASAVPEPANWAMMAGGFVMLGGMLRAQRRQRAPKPTARTPREDRFKALFRKFGRSC